MEDVSLRVWMVVFVAGNGRRVSFGTVIRDIASASGVEGSVKGIDNPRFAAALASPDEPMPWLSSKDMSAFLDACNLGFLDNNVRDVYAPVYAMTVNGIPMGLTGSTPYAAVTDYVGKSGCQVIDVIHHEVETGNGRVVGYSSKSVGDRFDRQPNMDHVGVVGSRLGHVHLVDGRFGGSIFSRNSTVRVCTDTPAAYDLRTPAKMVSDFGRIADANVGIISVIRMHMAYAGMTCEDGSPDFRALAEAVLPDASFVTDVDVLETEYRLRAACRTDDGRGPMFRSDFDGIAEAFDTTRHTLMSLGRGKADALSLTCENEVVGWLYFDETPVSEIMDMCLDAGLPVRCSLASRRVEYGQDRRLYAVTPEDFDLDKAHEAFGRLVDMTRERGTFIAVEGTKEEELAVQAEQAREFDHEWFNDSMSSMVDVSRQEQPTGVDLKDSDVASIRRFMDVRGLDAMDFDNLDDAQVMEFYRVLSGRDTNLSETTLVAVAERMDVGRGVLFEANRVVEGIEYYGDDAGIITLSTEGSGFSETMTVAELVDVMSADDRFSLCRPVSVTREGDVTLMKALVEMDSGACRQRLLDLADEVGMLDEVSQYALSQAVDTGEYGQLINVLRSDGGMWLRSDFQGESASVVMDVIMGRRAETDDIPWETAAFELLDALERHQEHHSDAEVADWVQARYAEDPHDLRIVEEDSARLDKLADELGGRISKLPWPTVAFEGVVFAERDGEIYMDPQRPDVDVEHVAARLSAFLCARKVEFDTDRGFEDLVPMTEDERMTAERDAVAAAEGNGTPNHVLKWTGKTSTGDTRRAVPKAAVVKGHPAIVYYNKRKTDVGVVWRSAHMSRNDGSVNLVDSLDVTRVHVGSLSNTQSLYSQVLDKFEQAYQTTKRNRSKLREQGYEVFVPETREEFQFYTNIENVVGDHMTDGKPMEELDLDTGVDGFRGFSAAEIVIPGGNVIHAKEHNTMRIDEPEI